MASELAAASERRWSPAPTPLTDEPSPQYSRSSATVAVQDALQPQTYCPRRPTAAVRPPSPPSSPAVIDALPGPRRRHLRGDATAATVALAGRGRHLRTATAAADAAVVHSYCRGQDRPRYLNCSLELHFYLNRKCTCTLNLKCTCTLNLNCTCTLNLNFITLPLKCDALINLVYALLIRMSEVLMEDCTFEGVHVLIGTNLQIPLDDTRSSGGQRPPSS